MYADVETAPVDDKLRAALIFLRKLTLSPGDIGPADVDAVRAAGVTDQAICDAVAVCTVFNIIDRIADALGFDVPTQEAFDAMAPMMLQGGYELPV